MVRTLLLITAVISTVNAYCQSPVQPLMQEIASPSLVEGSDIKKEPEQIVYLYNEKLYTSAQLSQLRPTQTNKPQQRWVTNFKSYHLSAAANSCATSMATAASWSTAAGYCHNRASLSWVCPTYYMPSTSWTGTLHFSHCAGLDRKSVV